MPGINFDYLLYLIYRLLTGLRDATISPALRQDILLWFDRLWWVCLGVALFLLVGIVYFSYRFGQLLNEQRERVYGKPGNIVEAVKEEVVVAPPVHNEDWEKVVKLIGSDNPNDWKLAIIEADKMLEQVVNNFAVPGDNMGEKMKNIERGDFQTIDNAWQAHKVRNRIAHESNFHISEREAKLAIDNFEKVFREFDFI